ncbi:uncharacterized protein PV07_03424 [Cladophialophora immunda]|uniref:Uncharacterized protein n=1 Tax=Cladophialophora immunda TaxID=569365 RepID=A0A0D1ZUM4_9EURO|nr:uncharacterized protein PV07_03424 [Cladophialophora immunda]KIW31831.1 hypothetical protein PV07_03424 [Cladophialophora immunda]
MVAARRYYHKAVSLLRHRLGKTDQPYATHGFAATVMFSCYEMLDATGLDWQRHLNGVFTYGRLRNINGSCGGIEQAGFWSIARQEVVCSIINRTRLRLDPDLWGIDLENIGQEGSEDLINNQVLTILAKVVDFTATLDTAFERDKQAVTERWQNLTQLLDHWERSVQDFMGPVCAYRKTGEVFSTIWFPHGVCANSWQMFHLARILLLTTNPRQGRNCMMAYRTVEFEVLCHARRICGIAQSKPHGSSRVNSVQPIYFAGCCFSETEERIQTARLLNDIEDDLGWAAKYRARDLYDQWGWSYPPAASV